LIKIAVKIISLIWVTSGLVLLGFSSDAGAGTKYAGDFLFLGADARSLGMGSASVAAIRGATSGYWNPAGLALLPGGEVSLMHSEGFAGIVNANFLGCALPLREGEGISLGLARVGVDGIKHTVLKDPDLRYDRFLNPGELRGTISNADYVLYISYGRHIHGRFSIGGSLKLIRRKIGDHTAFGYGLDMGGLYSPFGGVSLGLNLRDLLVTNIFWDTGLRDKVLPSLVLGGAVSRPLPLLGGEVTLSLAATLGSDFPAGRGDNPVNLGAEYTYGDLVSVRFGSESGSFTAGVGIRVYRFANVDYAFLSNSDLEGTHRVSMSFRVK